MNVFYKIMWRLNFNDKLKKLLEKLFHQTMWMTNC